ncbi:uncharacterized protein LOC123269264 [Cotesia glomerata]|uniref:uncharacterized protein LOC123269264 n=1 Tax=Cotesia glomerata TaxID=32391 RepID=UPI001D00572F|nr:uncharacterized protein LOC123269264 [Cotesia glomerata]
MKRLERYLEKKKLVLNEEKSKVMVFKKGEGRKKKIDWLWKGFHIEEVKEFTYLGYHFVSSGKKREHIKNLVKKANIAMRHTWGLGEEIFKNNFERRAKIFDSLVGGVMSYGAEIWGWVEIPDLEKVQKKYFKWALGVESCTPDAILYGEINREKMHLKFAKRAINYEERILKSRENGIIRECIKERRKGKGDKERLKERQNFLHNLMSIRSRECGHNKLILRWSHCKKIPQNY